jgi:hypothetical protein
MKKVAVEFLAPLEPLLLKLGSDAPPGTLTADQL